jgi:hypothetical protein
VNYPTTGPLSNRNKIINGAMVIDQRNAGAAVNLVGYGIDRWNGNTNGAGAATIQRTTDAPSGFTNSALITLTTADTSVEGDDYLQYLQPIEGFNVSDLGFGTASARFVTVSFWVKSSSAGTYGVGLRNGAASRSIVTDYTVNSANTWEYKSVTFAGDTSGTWATNNTIGLYLTFAVYQGPSSQAAADTWVGTNARATASISNTWAATSGATFQITGVQLEAGTVATPFEHRSFGQELALCQRYYYRVQPVNANQPFGTGGNVNGTTSDIYINFPVPLRSTPTALEQSGTATHYAIESLAGGVRGAALCSAVPSFYRATTVMAAVTATTSNFLSSGFVGILRCDSTSAFLAWSAEL